MNRVHFHATVGAITLLAATLAFSADTCQQAKLNISAGGTVNVVNASGSVILHPNTGQFVAVNATKHSNKVELDCESSPGNMRVEVRTHALPQQKPSADEAKVDYEISVPDGVTVSVRTSTAPITVDSSGPHDPFKGTGSDLTLTSDTGAITLRDIHKSSVRVHSVAAPVSVTNVNGGHLEITDSGGNVQMVNVNVPRATVNTIKGDISYQGDVAGGGAYRFITHSGAIDVSLPANASLDLIEHSVSGSVENDYPFKEKDHKIFIPTPGRSFAGTSNSGLSSVELQSFSGRIRVKKQ
jgi:DUF4097 and DUF4098 domain-containing protein YvlB